MRAWRGYIVGSALLEYRLNRELQEEHGISLADYEILVRLSEQPGMRMRMTQLATDVASSKSRVSHQVGRLENDQLVRREECPNDGRGVFAILTDKGYEVLRTAAPTHLRGVREHLVDHLTPEQQTALAAVFWGIAERLRPQP
ncbi:MAG TPA: MarR family transcriptional regulator [Pseudonocardiaceae bacterium]